MSVNEFKPLSLQAAAGASENESDSDAVTVSTVTVPAQIMPMSATPASHRTHENDHHERKECPRIEGGSRDDHSDRSEGRSDSDSFHPKSESDFPFPANSLADPSQPPPSNHTAQLNKCEEQSNSFLSMYKQERSELVASTGRVPLPRELFNQIPSIRLEELTPTNHVLGRGSHGVVEKYFYTREQKFVAVKKALNGNMRGQQALVEECLYHQKLKGESIVNLIGVCCFQRDDRSASSIPSAASTKATVWVVLEYMDHGSLRNVLANGAFSLQQKIQWCVQCAKAVALLHSQEPPILHRDLKPENFLVDANLNCKLSDFGFTEARDPLLDQSSPSNNAKGTYSYLAPEILQRHCSKFQEKMIQINCERKQMGLDPYTLVKPKFSAASDVYSLAIAMWDICKEPYDSCPLYKIVDPESPLAVLVCLGDRPLVKRPVKMPDEIRRLLQRSWRRVPEHRFTASEIVANLESILRQLSGSVSTVFTSPPSSSTSSAHARQHSIALESNPDRKRQKVSSSNIQCESSNATANECKEFRMDIVVNRAIIPSVHLPEQASLRDQEASKVHTSFKDRALDGLWGLKQQQARIHPVLDPSVYSTVTSSNANSIPSSGHSNHSSTEEFSIAADETDQNSAKSLRLPLLLEMAPTTTNKDQHGYFASLPPKLKSMSQIPDVQIPQPESGLGLDDPIVAPADENVHRFGVGIRGITCVYLGTALILAIIDSLTSDVSINVMVTVSGLATLLLIFLSVFMLALMKSCHYPRRSQWSMQNKFQGSVICLHLIASTILVGFVSQCMITMKDIAPDSGETEDYNVQIWERTVNATDQQQEFVSKVRLCRSRVNILLYSFSIWILLILLMAMSVLINRHCKNSIWRRKLRCFLLLSKRDGESSLLSCDRFEADWDKPEKWILDKTREELYWELEDQLD